MSASDGSGGEAQDLGTRRSNAKNSPFLVLAAGLLLFAAIVGAAFLIMRPTTLRIAVGPAGSDDLNLIQALAQNFAREGGAVRLSLIQTGGPVDSIALLRGHKADLAVARDDEEMPDGTDSVAIVRKNVVVLWSRPAQVGAKKGAKAKIKGIDELAGDRIGVVGRTQANITLLRVILRESGVDPDKVTVVQFNIDQIADHAEGQLDRCVHDGRSARQQDHGGRDRRRPRESEASRHSCRSTSPRRSRRGIRSTSPRKFPAAPSPRHRPGLTTRSKPSASIT